MNNMFSLEVVVTDVASAIIAEQSGASRLELCSALSTAGVSPSAGLIAAVKEAVDIPVYVMLRPREGDFVYDARELAILHRDLDFAVELGADGLVVGFLNAENKVDQHLTADFVQRADGRPVTFHRAIDCTPNLEEAMEAIIDAGCTTILTSGAKPTAAEGAALIQHLAEKAHGRISIMPGSGIGISSIERVFSPQIAFYHMSGRVQVKGKNTTDLFYMNYAEASAEAIRSVMEWLQRQQ